MTRFCKGIGIFLSLWAAIGLAKIAHAKEDEARPACELKHFGDCCSVIIDSSHDAAVATSIMTGRQVDYTLIINKGSSDCIFEFDGDMKVPMRSYVDSYNGMWIGGNFTLRYENDALGKGTCPLDIYYMTMGYDDFPQNCTKGHFEISRPNKPQDNAGAKVDVSAPENP